MSNSFINSVIGALTKTFGEAVLGTSEYAGDTIVLADRSRIHDLLKYLKYEQGFIYLADLMGADRFTEEDRFEVIYNLVSLRDRQRIFIKTRCPEDDPVLPTATDIWEAANWNEREVYDMFGIRFDGHPDPRRIFMPEDFEYFPLRKEFPLIGVPGSLELPSTNPDSE